MKFTPEPIQTDDSETRDRETWEQERARIGCAYRQERSPAVGGRVMPREKPDTGVVAQVTISTSSTVLEDLRRMIDETRHGVAVAVNAAMVALYWRVGKRINDEILKGDRAEYGAQILATVSQ